MSLGISALHLTTHFFLEPEGSQFPDVRPCSAGSGPRKSPVEMSSHAGLSRSGKLSHQSPTFVHDNRRLIDRYFQSLHREVEMRALTGSMIYLCTR